MVPLWGRQMCSAVYWSLKSENELMPDGDIFFLSFLLTMTAESRWNAKLSNLVCFNTNGATGAFGEDP